METPRKDHFRVPLDKTGRADEAVKKVLLTLLPAIISNEAAFRLASDQISLHQLRVATRRTRTILGQVKSVFSASVLSRFRPQFKWLTQLSGDLRDLDVFFDRIEEFSASRSRRAGGPLVAVSETLERERRLERTELLRALDTDRFKTLLADWQAFLRAPGPVRSDYGDAGRTILEVASERTWVAYRRVQRSSKDILRSQNVSAKAVHRLRIACKKLRYLMEAFAALYDEKEIEEMIRLFKRLQDSLGDFHDFALQRQKLTALTDQLTRGGRLDSQTSAAIEHFETYLEGLQEEARSTFRDGLILFTGRDVQATFKRMYGTSSDCS